MLSALTWLLGAVPLLGVAAPSRVPDSVGAYLLRGPVLAGSLTCGTQGSVSVAYDSLVLLTPEGRVARESWALLDATTDAYAHVRVGGLEQGDDVGVPIPGGGAQAQLTVAFSVRDEWTMRFAYASWGGTMSCSLTADGVEQPVLSATATFAIATDFDGEVALSSTGLTTAADATLQRDVDGFLHAIVTSWAGGIPPVGTGTVEATDPEGRVRTGSPVVIHEPTTGSWRFRLVAVACLPKTVFVAIETH